MPILCYVDNMHFSILFPSPELPSYCLYRAAFCFWTQDVYPDQHCWTDCCYLSMHLPPILHCVRLL